MNGDSKPKSGSGKDEVDPIDFRLRADLRIGAYLQWLGIMTTSIAPLSAFEWQSGVVQGRPTTENLDRMLLSRKNAY